MEYSAANPSELASKIKTRMLLIGVAGPLAILLTVWILSVTLKPFPKQPSSLIYYVLALVSLAETVFTIIFMKPYMTGTKQILQLSKNPNASVAAIVETAYRITSFFVVSPSVIGFAMYFLGSGLIYPCLLTLLSLLAYVILRPKEQEIENLLREVERAQQATAQGCA